MFLFYKVEADSSHSRGNHTHKPDHTHFWAPWNRVYAKHHFSKKKIVGAALWHLRQIHESLSGK